MKLLMPSLALYKPKKSLEIKSKSQRSSVGCVNTYRLFTDFYSYDANARPTTRQINERADTFAYNAKSELIAAQLGSDTYGYSYDNIGNRKTAQEIAEEITYATNSTNEYTAVNDFTPEFDLDGNQTKLQTSTGIWTVEYNAENRPTKFTSQDGNTIVEAAYDYMGRRASKKVTINGVITYHQAYIYRGYLQIAAENLIEGKRWTMHFITWDPTEPTATRPLAIEQKGTWFTYGLDLSKNVTELYTSEGAIATSYQYSPFGAVEVTGNTANPIQWSSEIADEELGLVYYNYRHYNPSDGRWINRDPIGIEGGLNLYGFVGNRVWLWDMNGLFTVNQETCQLQANLRWQLQFSPESKWTDKMKSDWKTKAKDELESYFSGQIFNCVSKDKKCCVCREGITVDFKLYFVDASPDFTVTVNHKPGTSWVNQTRKTSLLDRADVDLKSIPSLSVEQVPIVHEAGHMLGLPHPGQRLPSGRRPRRNSLDDYNADIESLMGGMMEMRIVDFNDAFCAKITLNEEFCSEWEGNNPDIDLYKSFILDNYENMV